MTKAEMLYEMLPTISQDCPVALEECVRHVFNTFKRHEIAVFFKNMEQISITCEDDDMWHDLLFAKVRAHARPTGMQFSVNIFPATLEESTDEMRFIVCQELGELYYLLQGAWQNGEVAETAADDFAFEHGFCSMLPVPLPRTFGLRTDESGPRATFRKASSASHVHGIH